MAAAPAGDRRLHRTGAEWHRTETRDLGWHFLRRRRGEPDAALGVAGRLTAPVYLEFAEAVLRIVHDLGEAVAGRVIDNALAFVADVSPAFAVFDKLDDIAFCRSLVAYQCER